MDYEKLYKEAIARIRKYTKDEYGCTRLKPEDIFPELAKSEDVVIKEKIIATIHLYYGEPLEDEAKEMIAWLENKGEKKLILPKWKYKKDNTPLLRDSLILNKYGCVAKSPSGALVSDVWVIDYDELAKLPKEEFEKQGEHKKFRDSIQVGDNVTRNEDGELVNLSQLNRVAKKQGSAYSDEIQYYQRDIDWLKSLKNRYTWKPSDLPHWKKSNLPDDNSTGFNSDYFCHKGYCINYKELFEKLPKDE